MAVHAGRALFEQGIGDRRGNAQRGVLVWVYDRGTANLSTLYIDRTKATPQDNPLTTNGLGNLAIFADPGDYEAHVDSTGAVLYFSVLPDWEDLVPVAGPWRGVDDAHPIVLKPSNDTRQAAIDLQTASATGFLIHLGVTNPDGGAALGIGVGGVGGPTTGSGILVDNYSTGIGIYLQNLVSITDDEAYGFLAVQNSNLAPLVRLVSAVDDGAPLLQLVGGPTPATGRVLDVLWNAGASEAGHVDSSDGSLNWITPIVARGGNPTFHLFQDVGNRNQAYWTIGGLKFLADSGSGDGAGTFYYATGLSLSTDQLRLQVAVQAALEGDETMMTAIAVAGGAFVASPKVGFFGATPIVKPTGVAVTAAGIHAALVSLGLIAA